MKLKIPTDLKTGKRGQPQKFAFKLFYLVSSGKYGMQWSKSGEEIIIEKNKYEKAVRSYKDFRLTSHHSFLRQLNLYEFHNVKHDGDFIHYKYKNDNFQRDSSDKQLQTVRRRAQHKNPRKRRRTGRKSKQSMSDSDSDDSSVENVSYYEPSDNQATRRSPRIANLAKPATKTEYTSSDEESNTSEESVISEGTTENEHSVFEEKPVSAECILKCMPKLYDICNVEIDEESDEDNSDINEDPSLQCVLNEYFKLPIGEEEKDNTNFDTNFDTNFVMQTFYEHVNCLDSL